MRLANVADAATYSGSLWQARTLNFQAYTNRAMVANQVSMAQAVTLQSWAAYGAGAAENISVVLSPIPVINTISQGVQSGMQQVESVVSPIAESLLPTVNAVNQGLSKAQSAMFAGVFVATPEIVASVVETTDPRFSVNTHFSGIGLSDNLETWTDFTVAYSNTDSNAMLARASAVNASRDSFSKDRSWKFFDSFWFYSTPLTRHRLYRQGSTELLSTIRNGENQWEWKAKDTLSLHNRLWRWRGTKRSEIPIGWAESYANSENSRYSFSTNCDSTVFSINGQCDSYSSLNRRAEDLASRGIRTALGRDTKIGMQGYGGLQDFRALSSDTLDNDNPTIKLKLEVSLAPKQQVATDQQDDSADETWVGSATTPVVHASSIGAAEVYYHSPNDGAAPEIVTASSYNPYWGARLTKVTDEDRALAIGLNQSLSQGGSESTVSTPNQFTGFEGHPDTVSRSSVGDFASVSSRQQNRLPPYQPSSDINTVLRDGMVNLFSGLSGEGGFSVLNPESVDPASLNAAANSALSELNDPETAATLLAANDRAQQLVAELQTEFDRIRQQVSDEFEDAFTTASEELNDRLERLSSDIAALERRRDNNSLSRAEAVEVEQEIKMLNDEVQLLTSDFEPELARTLMDIVADATSFYRMPFNDALMVVQEWQSEGEQLVGLPWDEEFDDD